MTLWRALALAASLLVASVASGCGQVGDEAERRDLSGRPIRIVTTIGMITDIAENVGGVRVDVSGLMGPGIDPHLYKASEGDVQRLAEADLVFYNGLHLEAKLADVLERLEGRAEAVTAGIPRSRLLSPPQFEGNYDPHV